MTTNNFVKGSLISVNGEVSVLESFDYTLENKPAVKLVPYGRPSLYTIVPADTLNIAKPATDLEGHACFLLNELRMARADKGMRLTEMEGLVARRREIHEEGADLETINAKIDRCGAQLAECDAEIARLGEELEVANLAVSAANNNEESVVKMTNLHVPELRGLAKIAGVVGYSKMTKSDLIMAINAKAINVEFVKEEMNYEGAVSMTTNNQEVVLGSLDDAISLETPVETPVVETKSVVAPTTEDVPAVGTYVKNLKNNRYYRINSYATKNNKLMANLIFKLKAEDKSTISVELPVSYLRNTEAYAIVTKEEVAKFYASAKAGQVPVVQQPNNKPAVDNGIADFRGQVSVGFDNRAKEFYMTNMTTGKKGYVSKDQSVDKLLKNYETTINGLKVRVQQVQKANATAKANNKTNEVTVSSGHVCAKCKGEVSLHIHKFLSLAKTQAKLPQRLQGKDFCYECQCKLGMPAILKSPDARRTVNLNSQQQVNA